jgi:hypothetical protein
MRIIISKEELEYLYDRFPGKEAFFEALEDMGYIDGAKVDLDYVSVFNRIYTLMRKRAFFKGVKAYKPGTPSWRTVTSIADEALIFCKEFDYPNREGFHKFITIAANQGWIGLKKFSMNKFKVTELYSLELEVMNAKFPELAEAIYKAYSGELANRYGVFKDYTEPDDYVHFIRASLYCKELGMQALDFVSHIMDLWAWTGNPIHPRKLYHKTTKSMAENNDGSTIVSQAKVKKIKIRKGFDRWE